MTKQLKVLVVEDSEDDALMIVRQLQKAGYTLTFVRVDTREKMREALEQEKWDLILSDYVMPHFSGLEALRIFQERDLEIPFLIISGKIGEDVAVEAMRLGAHDYILKHNLKRLVPAVEREVQEASVRREQKEMDAALRKLQTQYHLIAENTSDLITIIDEKGIVNFASPSHKLVLGYEKKDYEGTRLLDYIHPNDFPHVQQSIQKLLQKKNPYREEFCMRHKDRHWIVIEAQVTPILDENEEVEQVIIVGRDITERKKKEREIQNIQEKLSSILDSLDIAVWSFDAEEKRLIQVSSGVNKIFGLSSDYFMGNATMWKQFIHPDDLRELLTSEKKLLKGKAQVNEYRITIPDNKIKWIEEHTIPVLEKDRVIRINGVLLDITKRKQYEEQIKRQAYNDQLTGLPNRLYFYEQMKQILSDSIRNQKSFAILYIDIDRFKNVNDTFGHHIGDRLLREVAKRLKKEIRKRDIISRNGGDEFLLLMLDISHTEIKEAAQRILDTLSKPLCVEGYECFITASIGVSLFPINGRDVKTLIQHADQAMYRAKEQGKNIFEFYNKGMNSNFQKWLILERELHYAIERNQLSLFYQPQIDLKSFTLTGWEALARWYHPKYGWIPPAEFIHLAEESDLIMQLGEWILDTACRQNKDWQLEGYPPVRMSVNLSAKQFNRKNIVQTISNVLNATGLSPRWLELEITESMAMNINYTLPMLHRLKDIGISISIDDFGTGYSSLNYLKQFPIDTLKIDQIFVHDLGRAIEDSSIIRTIISMAHHLGLKVIAEGVEMEGQLNLLKEYDCHEGQGFFFSRPLPPELCKKFLKKSMELQ